MAAVIVGFVLPQPKIENVYIHKPFLFEHVSEVVVVFVQEVPDSNLDRFTDLRT
jgi:hypothetical protein